MSDHLRRQMIRLAKQRPELRGTLVTLLKRAALDERAELNALFRRIAMDLKAMVERDFDRVTKHEGGDGWLSVWWDALSHFELRFEPSEKKTGLYYFSEFQYLKDTDLDKALGRVRPKIPSFWEFADLKEFLQNYVRELEKDLDKARAIADDSRERHAGFQAYLSRVTNRLDKIWDGARIYNSHYSRDLTDHPVKINIPVERSMLTDKEALKALSVSVRKTLTKLLPEFNRGEHQLALVPRQPFSISPGGLDASLIVTREDGGTLY